MPENRRKFMRIEVPETACTVRIGGGETNGVILDESISGLLVGGLDLLILLANQEITIIRDGIEMPGRCRSGRKRSKDGMFEVGVLRSSECVDCETTSVLVNSYMRFDGCDIVCLPIAVLDDNQIKVRLMDGHEFIVRRNQLFQATRCEREQNLRNDKTLRHLAEVYSMMDGTRDWSNPGEVVTHEFGPSVSAMAAVK